MEAKTSTAAGEDCILASLEYLSNCKIYHKCLCVESQGVP